MRIQLVSPGNQSTTDPLPMFEHLPGVPAAPAAIDFDTDQGPVAAEDAIPAVVDRSVPRAVEFTWQTVPESSPETVFHLQVRPRHRPADLHVNRSLTGQSWAVYNLHIDTRYAWQVSAEQSDGSVIESPVWTFRTHASTPRWIRVPGMTNVRDIGGWALPDNRRIRQGLIYRSSEMDRHLEITEEGKKVLIEELGIRTDLDLRGSTEEPGPVLDEGVVRWVNTPVGGYGGIIEDRWRESYREAFRVLADPANHPVIFHCWGGADRAGTVAFLLQALLGLPLEDLMRDYELTSMSIWGERTRTSEQFQALLQALGSSWSDGSIHQRVEHYLRSIGVTTAEIDAIRDRMTGPAEGS